MPDFAELRMDVERRFPNLKRIEGLNALIKTGFGADTDLMVTIFDHARHLSGGEAELAIQQAMNTDVGFLASVTRSSSQTVRDLARYAVLLEAIRLKLGLSSMAGGYGALSAMRKAMTDANHEATARNEVISKARSIKDYEDRKRREAEAALALESARRKEEERKAALRRQIDEQAVLVDSQLLALSEGLKARRRAIRTEFKLESLEYYSRSLGAFISFSNDVDEILERVNKVIDESRTATAETAELKKKIITGIFEAIKNYAPPPFNLAGAAVVKLIEVLPAFPSDPPDAPPPVATDLTTRCVNDHLRARPATLIDQVLAKQVLPDPPAGFSVRKLMDHCRGLGDEAVRELVAGLILKAGLDSDHDGALEARENRAAAAIVGRPGAFAQRFSDVNRFVQAPGASVGAPPAILARPVAQRMVVHAELRRAHYYRQLEQFLSQLRTVSAHPPGKIDDALKKQTALFLYGTTIAAYFNTAQTSLPPLQDSEITFLEAQGFVSRTSSSTVSFPLQYRVGRFGYYYSDVFRICYVLAKFARNPVNPFHMFFVPARAGYDLNADLARYLGEANWIIGDAKSRHGSSGGALNTSYAKALS